jgi:hypothetical protein
VDERIELTERDLIEAVLASAEAQGAAQGALTTAELAEQAGMSYTLTLAKLHRLQKEGRLEVVRMRRQSLDGRTTWVPAYRLKGEP